MTVFSKAKTDALTAEYLREALNYDPLTGEFSWRSTQGRPVSANAQAGTINSNGYRVIVVRARKYVAHRLAWLFIFGRWPERPLDHVDGNKSNNAIANLREATDAENQRNRGKPRNNKSGYKGVSWCRSRKKWLAQITTHGRMQKLGSFSDPADAHRAYEAAATVQHGEFARVS